MDNINEIIHQTLWRDFDDEVEFPSKTPLLAHYTSIDNFDRIVEGQELWFANPLKMNDSEELLFGMNQGAAEFRKNEALIKACGSKEVFTRLLEIFDHHLNHFDENHVLDTYILCFSEHDADDYDGVLSMWRGYGANGNGIAFVIDTKNIEPNENSPIVISPVHYATTEERTDWIKQKTDQLAEIISMVDKTDETLNAVAWYWLERLKVFSLFTKHKGFEEEKEWRFVYLNDRDTDKKFEPMFGCHVSDKGVEPKLKLKLDQIPDAPPLMLETLVNRIILGPTAASEFSKRSLDRLLKLKEEHSLAEKIHASSIPYRP